MNAIEGTPGTVAGLVLAGGRGARMQAAVPKPLLRLGDRTLLEHVLTRLPPATAPVILSANDADAFASFGLPVIPDRLAGFAGPLAGLDAAAAHLARHHPGITHLLMLPGDTPFLPSDLLPRLWSAPGTGGARVAAHAGALQPTVALWPMTALAALPGFLARSRHHAIRAFLDEIGFQAVEFPPSAEAPGGDPFFNVNTPADLDLARAADARR